MEVVLMVAAPFLEVVERVEAVALVVPRVVLNLRRRSNQGW